ncbi:MAG: PDZ domain-containing protein [Myxococcota bacterium]
MPQLRTIGYAIYSFCLCLFVFGGYFPIVQFLGLGDKYETVIEVPQPLDSFITEEEFEALYQQVAQAGEQGGDNSETPEEDDGSSLDKMADVPLAQKPTKIKPADTPKDKKSSVASNANNTSNGNDSSGQNNSSTGSQGKGKGTGEDKTSRPTPPKKKTAQKRDCSSKIKGVRQVGENRYVVPAAVVDTYVNDLKKAEKLAVVGWATKNGKKQGVRIRRIRCRSVLKDAGFKNGDVVLAVNNTPVDSYPKVLRAYLKVKRTDNRLTVKVRRNGKVFTLRYRLT